MYSGPKSRLCLNFDIALNWTVIYYPRNDQLFKFDKDSPRLLLEDGDRFPCHIARLLSASKRARANIQVCVTSICTQVKSPREQDYRKLGRFINYWEKAVHLPLLIGADNSVTLIWSIDALFAVHPACKSHSRACLILEH